jgi:hypothetical protein
MMVKVTEADLVGSAADVAVTVTGFTEGSVEGAVYSPAEEIEPPPVDCHVTAWLVTLPTCALNCTLPVTPSKVIPGVIATDTGLARETFTATDADWFVSAAAFAVIVSVTARIPGSSIGAVYFPDVLIVPQGAPEQPVPEIDQITF